MEKVTIQIDEHIQLALIDDTYSQSIFELVVESRNYLREWLSWVDYMDTVEFIRDYIRHSERRNEDGDEWAFVIIEDGITVGRIGVYKIDRQNGIGEIGYWIAENKQGKGIVTKSCKGLINFCFNELKLNRLEIRCGAENYKSQTIPERLHFTKVGVIQQGELVRNQFIDLNLYSLLRSQP